MKSRKGHSRKDREAERWSSGKFFPSWSSQPLEAPVREEIGLVVCPDL